MRVFWRAVTVLLFIALLVCVHIWYWLDPVSLADIIKMRDAILLWVDQHAIAAALCYTGAYILSILFGIPISATFIGGYLFGFIHGLMYSLIGVIIGTFILCSFVRYVVGKWVQQWYGDQLEPFNKEIERFGVYYIAMIHAMPFMPSFLPHIAASISTLSLAGIITANIIGALPLMCVYTFAGSSIHMIDSVRDIVYYVAVFVGTLAAVFVGVMRYRAWQNRHA